MHFVGQSAFHVRTVSIYLKINMFFSARKMIFMPYFGFSYEIVIIMMNFE